MQPNSKLALRPWGKLAAVVLGCALMFGALVAVAASLHGRG